MIKTYGLAEGYSQLQYDVSAFIHRDAHPDVPPRGELFKRIADQIVPGLFEWHAWTDKVVDTMSRYRWSGFTGCSNSAKTFNATNFACLWWAMAPHESSVILCSTTMKMLRKRAWADVVKFSSRLGGNFGNLVDSQTVWKHQAGDDRHAIFGVAVQEGNLIKVADNIKGIHTKRQMVIIDEATAVPAAIWDACTNLYAYPIDSGGEFVLVALANARSRLDQFGRYIEPENGWDSVSIETDEWETKPRIEDGEKVKVVRFDFRKSPNVLADKRVSKYLPEKRRVLARLASLKARGAENNPQHWSNDLGFPPPEGIAKTVFTESVLRLHDAYGSHQFTGTNFTIIGAFDPARTGDRACIRFAALGEIRSGVMGIEWCNPYVIVEPDSSSPLPISYQLMNKARAACTNVIYRGQRYTCQPQNFGIDGSNEASFVDLCQREWSPDIVRILFQGATSDEPVSHEDSRSAKIAFKNKRAEMYFRTEYGVESGQIKGIDHDTAAELCALEYSEMKDDGTTKPIVLQDKQDYKLKFGASPDLSDAGVMTTEIARMRGFKIIETGYTVNREKLIVEAVKQAEAVYKEDGPGYASTADAIYEFHTGGDFGDE